MKKILGLDLGTSSVGWALVNEAESDSEKSSIIKLGVRINPLTVDEVKNFEKQKGETLNQLRTQKRSMRRNLQRYKLRRNNLIAILKSQGWITDATILSENGNRTTFETYRLRAKAVHEEISLEQLARVLLMINKKRGYKSSRKVNSEETGSIIDGIDIAKKLYNENITPAEYCLPLLKQGKRNLPDFYRSDLQSEFDKIWRTQSSFYPELLTDELHQELLGKTKKQTWSILSNKWEWEEEINGETKHYKLKGITRTGKKNEIKLQTYSWRVRALTEKFGLEELAIVLQEINDEIAASSGYLGNISDRSKELTFRNLTVGEYLMESLDNNPNVSLRNTIFYRQDYLDEFERIWSIQSEFHPELTDDLKHEIRDITIFYQRRLKSQKGLIGLCELEQKEITIVKNDKETLKLVGNKQIPKSSPLFQEFKIWQTLNNVKVKEGKEERALTIEEMQALHKELSVKDKLSKKDVIKLLWRGNKSIDINFKELPGNTTRHSLLEVISKILELSGHTPIDFNFGAEEIEDKLSKIFSINGWNTEILKFDSSAPLDRQPSYRLWHLLYSYESDNSLSGNDALIKHLMELCKMEKEYAKILVSLNFKDDYGNLSAKAIRKILPYLQEGLTYDKACEEAGYRHSKSSLTREEIESKELQDRLQLLPKNSLRNPIVEKVLNQMVNVVNEIIETYGRPDEIRVELARELKKNAKERAELTDNINKATAEQEVYRKILQTEFGIAHVSHNDIVRYRLYEELKENGYHTLYSNKYIPKEKLFSTEFDIEHIIPRARLFDDSFSNKTIEAKDINIEKGNKTAYDFVLEKYGEAGLAEYIKRCEALFKGSKNAKLRKLKMSEAEIPSGFVDRDLRNTQYISRMALSMLGVVCRRVVATTGSITDQLRKDWQLVDLMKELNWDKYRAAGEVNYYINRDGKKIGEIQNWTKRNDHRHHAVDALTVAFTKPVLIQYFNNKNASFAANSNERAIKAKYVEDGKVIAPMPLHEFRADAKHQLEGLLISLQSKNKVVTRNQNKTKSSQHGSHSRVQLTPRGQLHEETIYGRHKEYVVSEKKVNGSFTEEVIATVCKKVEREALLERLHIFGGDAKKAFTGKNSLDKNSIWINQEKGIAVPLKVRTVSLEPVFTIRKAINKDLKVEKIVDAHIRKILEERLAEYGGDPKVAFTNLDENPIWLNKEKGLSIKAVTIKAAISGIAIRDKHDKDGHRITDSNNVPIPSDYIATGSNHHAAIYRHPKLDKKGLPMHDENGKPIYEFEEVLVSFYEAVTRVNQGLPVIDRNYKRDEGWELLFTLKANEYVVFPNEETGFNPKETDLKDPDNYSLISPNLFRVQKFSSKYYVFRHHLETKIDDNKSLKETTWKRVCALSALADLVKVRLNHIGEIVDVGEY
jgi:CRISPR-associated endonuclease Csn1